MFFDLRSGDSELVLWLVQKLQSLQGGDFMPALGAEVADLENQGNRVFDIPATALYPQAKFVVGERLCLGLIAGTSLVTQANNLLQYWRRSSFFGTNSTIPPSAGAIYNNYERPVVFPNLTIPPRMILAGYSYGGVCAEVLMAYYRSFFGASDFSLVTFGAPKAWQDNLSNFSALADRTRYMTTTDPIPLLPPRVGASVAMIVAEGVLRIREFELYFQQNGGVVVDSAGNLTSSTFPPGGSIQGVVNMATFIFKWATDRAPSHWIDSYVTAISNWRARVASPAPRVVVHAPAETRNDQSRRDANRDAARARQVIVEAGAAQNAPSLAVPPEQAFKTFKIEGAWWVLFGGFPVAVGGTRKRAGAMALRGNEFLRRLQRMAGVDVNALASLLPIYLAAASTPDNGFVPPINDTSNLG